jgi:hypothetical protein
MNEKVGNVLPLIKSATSTLYYDLAFFNTTLFSPITKSATSTILQDQHKDAAIPSSIQSHLIFHGPPKVVQYFTDSSLSILVSGFLES